MSIETIGNGEVPKTREQLVLEKLLPVTTQFTIELNESLKNRATTWHRLHIRLKNGYIELCRTEGGKDHSIEDPKDELDGAATNP